MEKSHRSVLFLPCWYDSRMHEGVARFARENSWDLHAEWAMEKQIPAYFKGDGIISYLYENNPISDFILSQELPLVTLNHNRHTPEFPRVVMDDKEIGEMAAEFFIRKGIEHFVCIGEAGNPLHLARMAAYQERLQKSGLNSVDLLRDPGPGTTPLLPDWLRQILKQLPTSPTAVFCLGDEVAVMLIRMAMELGIPVPDELMVLSTPNKEVICETSVIPLSSMDLNYERIGYEAGALLQRMMDGEIFPPDYQISIPPKQIVERASTQALAIDNRHVAKALAYIRKNYSMSIRVNDVALASGLNRRSLERAFQTYLRRSILQDILMTRFAKAKELL